MKKISVAVGIMFICISMAIFLSPLSCKAASLVWDASSGTVNGYMIYWGSTPSDRSNSTDIGNTTQYDLTNLPLSEGMTYYLCVTAYNAAGESPPCTPVIFTPGDNTPPLPPTGLTTQ